MATDDAPATPHPKPPPLPASTGPARRSRGETAGRRPGPLPWVSVPVAARHLGSSADALRRMLERRAVKTPDGGVEADVDGVRGRKLGRVWRVQLGPAWLGKADAA